MQSTSSGDRGRNLSGASDLFRDRGNEPVDTSVHNQTLQYNHRHFHAEAIVYPLMFATIHQHHLLNNYPAIYELRSTQTVMTFGVSEPLRHSLHTL